MPAANLVEIISLLTEGEISSIIGTPEADWVDFKGEPYDLSSSDGQLELAKDVTAFANAGGGILLIGFRTRRDTDSAREFVTEVRRVAKSRIDPKKYSDIVENSTYPPLRDLSLRWFLEDGDTGVFAITVPAKPAETAPVLVLRAKEEGSRREILLGLFQRIGDRVARLSAGEVHADLQIGRTIRLYGLGGVVAAPPAEEGPDDDTRLERLRADTRDADLEGRRRYWLQAWPTQHVDLVGIHSTGEDGVRRILTSPEYIRGTGFHPTWGIEPRVISGGGIRAITERGSVSLLPNGLLTWVVDGGSRFLAWADEHREELSFNPLALIESTYEFCRFYVKQLVPKLSPASSILLMSGGLHDLHEGNRRSLLCGGAGRPLGDADFSEAPDNDFELNAIRADEKAPEEIAFQLLRQVYGFFGLDEAAMPYCEGEKVSYLRIRELRRP